MAATKGTMRRITEAVGDAVHSLAAGVGLASDPAPEPQQKAARKAARKAAVARAEKAKRSGRTA
jgi:hypothetical protein